MKTLSNIMSPFPVDISTDASLRTVLATFRKTELSHLIVVDNKGQYKGIISKEDVLNRINWILELTSGQTFTKLEMDHSLASEIMTTNTLNVKTNDSLDYAAELLLQGKFHALPVMDNGKVVGIITPHDLVKHYYENSAFAQNANHE